MGFANRRRGAAVPLPLKGLTPLTKIGSANTSIPSPFSIKNEPPIREVRIHFRSSFRKTVGSRFGVMILELKTWRKRNGGSKRIDIRECQPLSAPDKNEPPIKRGSLTLPEFVPKNQGVPDLAQCFWMKSEYRKAAKGAWRIKHTRAVLAAFLTELFAKSIRQIRRL